MFRKKCHLIYTIPRDLYVLLDLYVVPQMILIPRILLNVAPCTKHHMTFLSLFPNRPRNGFRRPLKMSRLYLQKQYICAYPREHNRIPKTYFFRLFERIYFNSKCMYTPYLVRTTKGHCVEVKLSNETAVRHIPLQHHIPLLFH